MAVRRVLTVASSDDEEILRQKSQPVATVDQKINKIIRDLTDTMFAAEGVGISAIQIGEPAQVIVVRDMKSDDDDDTLKTITLLNPEITFTSPTMEEDFDGCLSIPGYWGLTDRSVFIRVRYQNRFGREINRRFEGYMARVVQHEVDHLGGILYTDHISDPEKFYEAEEIPEEEEAALVGQS
jgi:peptide deformylase